MKKGRIARGYTSASFASALAVIFTPQNEVWRCFDVKSTLTLVYVDKKARQTLQTWLDAVVLDLSLGKEALPIRVQLSPSTTFDTQLIAVFKLMMPFTYITSIQLPLASMQYKLPQDLLSKQQTKKQWKQVCHGRQVNVRLAKSIGKGWGVFATEQIRQGEFVAEYTGELISSRDMQQRYRDCYDQEALNYVLSLREHVAKRDHLTLDFDIVRTNVDATYSGNLTRFINHSCSSNLDVKAIRVDSYVPRLALFAQKCIENGEELTIDYGDGSLENAMNGQVETRGKGRACQCTSRTCRGYLPFVLE
ncbi:unnamed protein product [Peronospora farinosa]|uniref:SET domain-containing protein n=1 Tax=Peronospora farinosa TaxID=134698 RepID=A0AAV0ST93_9STRA|nr:unnamed protein product [Peronospora farinosa]CAI5707760.1 unnamed protein product [Peronospora farinosa]